jgi:hypothetical protein
MAEPYGRLPSFEDGLSSFYVKEGASLEDCSDE